MVGFALAHEQEQRCKDIVPQKAEMVARRTMAAAKPAR